MKTSINSFWNYFNQHSQKFISQQPFNNECPRAILRELQDLLNQYQPNLGFRLGIKNGRGEIIITAHGNPYLFKAVDLLVLEAPAIDNWTVTAFIQPLDNLEQFKNGNDQAFIYHSVRLRISELHYRLVAHSNPNLVSLKLFVPGGGDEAYNEYRVTAAHVLLEYLLGEKAFANEIHTVEICCLEQAQQAGTAMFPLYMLRGHLEVYQTILS